MSVAKVIVTDETGAFKKKKKKKFFFSCFFFSLSRPSLVTHADSNLVLNENTLLLY